MTDVVVVLMPSEELARLRMHALPAVGEVLYVDDDSYLVRGLRWYVRAKVGAKECREPASYVCVLVSKWELPPV